MRKPLRVKNRFIRSLRNSHPKAFLWWLVVFPFLAQCSGGGKEYKTGQNNPYDFRNGGTVFRLHKDLNEISGLCWYRGRLLTVMDEKGIIYVLDPGTGEITDRYEFDEVGDYEGVAVDGDTIFALQSDGDIFKLFGLTGDKIDYSKRYKTDLDEDCEGLLVEPNGDLIIATKDKGELGDRDLYRTTRADLYEEKKPDAFIGIDAVNVKDALLGNTYDKAAMALAEAFSTKDHAGILNPSGIARHPIDKSLYILSGTSSILIILEPDGKFRTAYALPSKLLAQPEGICFSPDGDLYISSERAGFKSANLIKYTYNAK